MEITEINQQNFTDINKARQPFEIIGKIKPVFVDGIWTYTEEIYEQIVKICSCQPGPALGQKSPPPAVRGGPPGAG